VRFTEELQAWLKAALADPIAELLSRNSHLTKIQLETLLIDILSDNIAGKTLKYDQKASLRLVKAKISRGSFNRTLAQAKNNVTKSIYTVILLGYLGIFANTSLDPYLEVANKLNAFVSTFKGTEDHPLEHSEPTNAIKILRQEIERTLQNLSI